MSVSPRRKIYPKQGRVTLDGGLNNKFQRSIIDDNESPDCANVVFSDGAVGTRDGTSKLNTAAIGSFVIDGLYTRHADTDVETMVAFAGGTAWQLSGTSFSTIGSAQSVFTAGVRVACAEQENHLFIGNGGVIPYKWNGTDFTRHGVYPPTSGYLGNSPANFTVASNSAGTLTGDYQYKVTFVNTALVESDVGPAMSTFAAAGAVLRLTSIPVAPQSWGVGYRRIYRTVAGGSTFKRVTELADNTTTAYNDSTADGSLGVTAPTDNGVPPKYSVICYHQSRLFMNDPANPVYIWYTGLGSDFNPYTVQSTNFIKVGDASGDTVRAISVYQNSILVSCTYSQWLIYMTDTNPTNWQKIRVTSPYGSESPFGFFDYNNKQCFPAIENGKFVGFAAVSGTGIEASSTFLTVGAMGSLLKSERIEPDMFLIQEGYLKNISAITYKNKAYIAVTYGNSNVTNNRIYQFDYSLGNLSKSQKEAWVPWTGLNASQFTVYNGYLYYGSSTATGFVYKMEAGAYNDDGSAIDSYYWTKEFSGYPEDYNFHKDFRLANLLIEKPGNYMMTVAYRTDSDSSSGSEFNVDLNPGTSLWGTLIWGVGNWSENVSQEDYTLNLGGASGKRIQFKFSNQNTANQSFKVHGLNFSYNLKGQR